VSNLRQNIGLIMALVNASLVGTLILVGQLSGRSQDNSRVQVCQNIYTFSRIGCFEMFALAANFEAAILLLGSTMCSLGLFCSILSLLVVPCFPWIASRRNRNPKLKDVSEFFQHVKYPDLDVPAECAICLCCYEEGEACVRLPCCSKHCFHEDCITGWLRHERRCPLCRYDLEQTHSNAYSSDVGVVSQLYGAEQVEDGNIAIGYL